jgi:hypothetical protein
MQPASVVEPPVLSWDCPTCKNPVVTAFCPGCGERPAHKREFTLLGLLEQGARIFTHIDGRLIGSFRLLLGHPGILTAAFLHGQRKPYIGPFQIFLIANVVFFAVQSFSNMKIFSNSLDFRLHGQLWSDFGQTLVANHLATTGRSFEQYAPVFDQAIGVNAKSLIGLMVPVLALCPPLVFWRSRRPLAVHVVFALHFYAFLLMLFCGPLAAMSLDALFGGDGIMSQRTDDITSLTLWAACAAYLYFAIGPVYGARGGLRLLQTLVLAVAATFIFFLYRFALLPITLYTT